ncbi:F0F1 ATP synthase subunit delta [uncultured Muribaculum sp.]|uniref:F0F1 ATP synthase subunit delta n=1 Tax=uncultured Muribaculum sp. TaxID=1918613 RepID=UPI0025FEC2E3|nr:F0F1 ATP synthase subunit delta [uncultured Muribaculum sp.]
MDQGLIPNRYAKALYKFALEKGAATRVYELMKRLCASFAGQPRLQEVVANPFVATDDKTALLSTAAGAESADTVFADFMKLLVENRRIDMVRAIALRYLDIYRRANNICLVKIVTAADMPAEVTAKLHALVERHLPGATVEYTHLTDPSIIGGFVVDVNSERLDASLASELRQLRLNLLSK